MACEILVPRPGIEPFFPAFQGEFLTVNHQGGPKTPVLLDQCPTLMIPAAAAVKLLLSCPTLCNPIDGSRPGSLVPGILQARTLEWVAISFLNA